MTVLLRKKNPEVFVISSILMAHISPLSTDTVLNYTVISRRNTLTARKTKIKVYYISAFETSPYPEEKLVKSQVEAISCMRKTWGLFQTGVGMSEKAYGPARGGRVTGLYTTAGPRSGFTTGRPGAGIGRNGGRFCATKPRPRPDPEI